MSGMQLDLVGQAYKISFKKNKLSTGNNTVLLFVWLYPCCVLQVNMSPCRQNESRTGDVTKMTRLWLQLLFLFIINF